MPHLEKIELLRKVRRVEAPPFLLTRIRAKIDAARAEKLPATWAWAGSLAFGLLLFLNVVLATRTETADPAAQYRLHQSPQLYADEN